MRYVKSFSCLRCVMSSRSPVSDALCQVVLLSPMRYVKSFSCLLCVMSSRSPVSDALCQVVLLSPMRYVKSFSDRSRSPMRYVKSLSPYVKVVRGRPKLNLVYGVN
jgi:hypothetical protein